MAFEPQGTNKRLSGSFLRTVTVRIHTVTISWVSLATAKSLGRDGRKSFPWLEFQKSPHEFVRSIYMPDGFVLKDPSRMLTADIDLLVAHWRARSELKLEPLVFHGYLNTKGSIAPCGTVGREEEAPVSLHFTSNDEDDGLPQNEWSDPLCSRETTPVLPPVKVAFSS